MTIHNTDLFFESTSDTGKVEVSSFEDVDAAVINRIGHVMQKLVVSNPEHKRNKSLAAFAAKPIEKKIAAGEFDSPRKFLLALNRSAKKTGGKVHLPMVYVTRDPSFSFVDKGVFNDTKSCYPMMRDDVTIGQFDISCAALNYQINFVGWQHDNIESLALLLTMWLRHKSDEHSFTAATRIADIPYELDVSIVERNYATVDSASLPFDEDKTRVLAVSLTVHAESVLARYTETTRGAIIGEGVLI